MMRAMALTTFFLLIPLIISSVRCEENPSKPAASSAREYSDPATPITVKVGEDFAIGVDSNRTTGYQWQLAEPLDKNVLKLVGIEYKPPQSRRIGAGGKDVITIKAVGKGKAQVSLKYVRPWEKDVPPAKKLTFAVEVH